jgi:hypothetical protein
MWLPIVNTVGSPTHACLNGQLTHLKPSRDQLLHPVYLQDIYKPLTQITS